MLTNAATSRERVRFSTTYRRPLPASNLICSGEARSSRAACASRSGSSGGHDDADVVLGDDTCHLPLTGVDHRPARRHVLPDLGGLGPLVDLVASEMGDEDVGLGVQAEQLVAREVAGQLDVPRPSGPGEFRQRGALRPVARDDEVRLGQQRSGFDEGREPLVHAEQAGVDDLRPGRGPRRRYLEQPRQPLVGDPVGEDAGQGGLGHEVIEDALSHRREAVGPGRDTPHEPVHQGFEPEGALPRGPRVEPRQVAHVPQERLAP